MCPVSLIRPRLLLALTPKTKHELFTREAYHQLERLVEIEEIPQDPFDPQPVAIEDSCGIRILVTSWKTKPLDFEELQALPDLELLIHAAGTVRQVLPEPFPNGFQICTGAHINARPVAEFTLGVILTALRDTFAWRARFGEHGSNLWWYERNNYNPGYAGKRICLVGYGSIARHLIHLLQPFGFEVFVVSDFITNDEAQSLGVGKVSLDWGVAECDVVSLHEAEIPPYLRMIDRRRLEMMKPQSWLINTARGGLIDEDALIEILREGRIWALLDVAQVEPPPEGHPFYSLPNCILTPHIAGSMNLELKRFGDYIVREVANYLAGRPLEGIIPHSSLAQRA